jgi:hypothetical protein
VRRENLPTCAPVYDPDRPGLLFRVLCHRTRIVLEVFHVLSDGTGALWFLTDLVTSYIERRAGAGPDRHSVSSTSASADARTEEPASADRATTHRLGDDGFAAHFRLRRKRATKQPAGVTDDAEEPSAFDRAARMQPLPTVEPAREPRGSIREAWKESRHRRAAATPVYRIRGTRTPDHRTRAVELTLPTSQVLACARAEGVALTMYLTAVFFESVRAASGGLGRSRTLAASVPVNLRQFFPSTSARNFFATVRVEHTYAANETALLGVDSVSAVSRALQEQFTALAVPEELERKIWGFVRVERSPLLRVVPRPLKDLVLAQMNRATNRGLTVAVSNLGRMTFPAVAEPHVGRTSFHVSAARPQFCAISHGEHLTVSFTSPFVETDHVREFARFFSARGIDVTVAAARVTEAELGQVAT